MPPASKRYIVVGPRGLPLPAKSPGIYDTMQWRSGGASALPIPFHLQLKSYTEASFTYIKLQAFFDRVTNAQQLPPRVLAEQFTSSEEFVEIADTIQHRGQLIWAVKYGAKPGVYTDTAEALASVDASGRKQDGRLYQQAYAFRSLRDTTLAQMLNDYPTAALHDYNPNERAKEAEELRNELMGGAAGINTEDSPSPDPDHNIPQRESTPPPAPPSAPSTPRRSQSVPSGNFNIYFSPNVAVRVNSPGPSNAGPLTPTSTRGSDRRFDWVKRGRRSLQADGFSSEQVASIEATLMTCESSDEFANAVGNEFGVQGAKALHLWETYKGR